MIHTITGKILKKLVFLVFVKIWDVTVVVVGWLNKTLVCLLNC